MEFSSAIYAAPIAFFLLFCYSLLKSKHKLPPQAGGAHPILGHLHLMGGGAGGSSAHPPHINLAALADQHGPIFTIRLGVHRAVVVSSCKLAKELFTVGDVAVSSRVTTRASKHLSYNFAMFGFSPYGPYWRKLRKLVSVELLISSRVQLQSHIFVSEIAQSVKDIYTLWEEKRNESGWVLVDMKKWFGDLNLNAILRMVAGKRVGGDEDDAEELRRCREVIETYFHLAGLFVPADAVPWLGWLDLGRYEKRMKETAKEVDGIVGRWLAEHRRKEYSGEDKAEDFMDVMLSAVRGLDLGGQYDDDDVIKATCLSMILGGSDTSTAMLIWALSLLLNNCHVLTKAQVELDKHVGRQRRVNESDIQNLVYLQAIVKETLRLYPAGPLGMARAFNQDCYLGDYHIPKGTWLIVNLWKLQRDPDVWLDKPLEFKPERFLTTHRNVDVKGKDFALIPFGAGRRMCPGFNLGMHTLHLVLANFLQAFHVATVSEEAVDMTESAGLVDLKATPLDVLVAPRLSPSLY